MFSVTSFKLKAITKEPNPENIPLMTTTINGSFKDNLLVKLFSKPQDSAASKTKSEPKLNLNALMSSTDSMMLATVTKMMAIRNRLGIASLKIKKANIAVATTSKLLSKATFSGLVILSPNSKMMGANISSRIIPMMAGNSLLVNRS